MTETPQQYLARIGRKGGKARVASQTPEQRAESARRAAAARWAKDMDKLHEQNERAMKRLEGTAAVVAEGTKRLKKLVAKNARAKKRKP